MFNNVLVAIDGHQGGRDEIAIGGGCTKVAPSAVDPDFRRPAGVSPLDVDEPVIERVPDELRP